MSSNISTDIYTKSAELSLTSNIYNNSTLLYSTGASTTHMVTSETFAVDPAASTLTYIVIALALVLIVSISLVTYEIKLRPM